MKKAFWFFLIPCICFLSSCAVEEVKNAEVLEEVQQKPAESDPTQVQPPAAPVKTETFYKLSALLMELKYEGVGLELEKDETLMVLFGALASPEAKNRKITRIYTGEQPGYDEKSQSLTLGPPWEATNILNQIKKAPLNTPPVKTAPKKLKKPKKIPNATR